MSFESGEAQSLPSRSTGFSRQPGRRSGGISQIPTGRMEAGRLPSLDESLSQEPDPLRKKSGRRSARV